MRRKVVTAPWLGSVEWERGEEGLLSSLMMMIELSGVLAQAQSLA
jgi:hypothetical protein